MLERRFGRVPLRQLEYQILYAERKQGMHSILVSGDGEINVDADPICALVGRMKYCVTKPLEVERRVDMAKEEVYSIWIWVAENEDIRLAFLTIPSARETLCKRSVWLTTK